VATNHDFNNAFKSKEIGIVTAHRLICVERATQEVLQNTATLKQQESEPNRARKLYCCLPVAQADL